MAKDLNLEESHIVISDRPINCLFCEHDVFIPYVTYKNEVEPEMYAGIQANYTAICMHCGSAIQFELTSNVHVNPIITEAKLQAQKRCLLLALQILVQEKKIDDTVLTLAEEEQYVKVMVLLKSRTNQVEEMPALSCLAIALNLNQLSTHNIVDAMQMHRIVMDESYPGIEPFLKQFIK